jgi:3-oxo-4-pregnene-20-carboxyl-CoA dehydrogenase alpha subunit
VDFEFSESQREVTRLAAEVLAGVEMLGSADGVGAADPWKALAQSGLLALSVPERLGGDGLGIGDTAQLVTEIGRRAACVPALATLMTGIAPIAAWGDDDLQRSLLPAAAAGELILTAAFREPGDPRQPATMVSDGTGAGRTGAGRTVSGRKVGVLYGAEAARILVSVSFAAGGTGVVVVDPAAGGVTLTRTPTSTGEPECTLQLDSAPVAATLSGVTARDLHRLAIAGACCLADGALAGALALTTGYIANRKQFGRPLAQFQAVSQQIADVYIASRTLHLITLSAIWRLESGRDPDDDLDAAAWWTVEEALPAVLICHHLHGGIGVDMTYPLHRFSSLIRDVVRYLGGASAH